MAKRSLQSQLAEAERELAMRRRVYPGQVGQRKMRQGEADELILLQECICDTLRTLQQHEDVVREAIRQAIAKEKEAAT